MACPLLAAPSGGMDNRAPRAETVFTPHQWRTSLPTGSGLALHSGVRCRVAEYNRYETPMTPGSHWPDGSPVSNWSQAVAALARHETLTLSGGAQPTAHHPSERRLEVESRITV